jgi:hypothetical protein
MQSFFFGALLLIVRFASRVSLWAPIVLVTGCLHPFVLGYQGIIWKDVLFANLAVFAFSLFFAGCHVGGLRRYTLYVFGLLTAACAALVRQNGGIVLVVLAVAMAHLEFQSSSLGARALKLVVGCLAAIVLLLPVSIGTARLIGASATRAPDDSFAVGLMILMQYDIAGIIARDERADLALPAQLGLDVSGVREDVVRHYSAVRLDSLNEAQKFANELNKLSFSQTATAWAGLMAASPVAYLQHRLAVFGWMLWPPDMSKCVPIHFGIDGPRDVMASLELAPIFRPSDRVLYSYAASFFDTPLYRHGFFLVIAGLLLASLAIGPRRSPTAPAAALLVATFLFAGSWVMVGVSCDVRYMYFLPLGVFVAMLMLTTLEPARAGIAPSLSRRTAPRH